MKNSLSYTKVGTAGFSLVELMVVVAIIGILATVAIPNFTKFQAKAKQSSAKSELTGIYTAEKTFFTEYSTYHPNLPYIGYVPDGWPIAGGCPQANPTTTRYYTVGFGTIGAVLANAQPIGAPAMLAAPCNALGDRVTSFRSTVAVIGADPVSSVGSATTFNARAIGMISAGGVSNQDTWSIDQNKTLFNATSGI